MLELPALERSTLGSPPPGLTSSHCLHLLYCYKQHGKDRDGDHLCYVTDFLGGDVKSLYIIADFGSGEQRFVFEGYMAGLTRSIQ
jgi:hypothetical protein